VFAQDHKVETLTTKRVVAIRSAQGNRAASFQFDAQIGLLRLRGPVRAGELLEWIPGDAFGLPIGRSHIPGVSTRAGSGAKEFDVRQVGLPEPSARYQQPEAMRAQK